MAPQTSIKLTYEDYLAIPEDGRRHEIIDGEHYLSPSPNPKHQAVIISLIEHLSPYVRRRRLGRVFCAPCEVLLGEHGIMQPDVLFISTSREAIITPENIQGAPDLVIEVLSSNRDRDERVKYQAYELAGVPEYWIIDPYAESAKVFRRAADKFAPVQVNDALTTPLLPGFELSVADLFA